MHTGRLVLTPVDARVAPERTPLIASLTDAELIGEPLDRGRGRFHIGSRFLSLVTFAGCAVRIPGEPGPDPGAPFCHVSIPPASGRPRLLAGRNTRPPRCPGCRARLVDWREQRERWQAEPDTPTGCRGCGETRPPWHWDWKHQGGFGRLFVCLEEVFPGEAVPTPSLLELLSRTSGSDWGYFYVQD